MKFAHVIAGTIVGAMLMSGTAVGTTYVTSGIIKDETITADDIGPDVTKIKVVNITVPSQDPVTEERCYDGDAGQECDDYVVNEATTITRTVRCASGNLVSGGVRFPDLADMWNLDVQSFPATDDSWTYNLYNDGPDDIKVQLRVVCM